MRMNSQSPRMAASLLNSWYVLLDSPTPAGLSGFGG
jgi:hypothetical protein